MIECPRRARSTASASKDRPGAIASGARVAAWVDGEPAVGTGRATGREHALGLRGERLHLLGGGPEAGGGQLLRVVVLVLGRLPGDDDEPLPVLVVPEAELADAPLGLSGLRRRDLGLLRSRPEPLGLEELPDADDQALDVELLAVQDEGVAAAGCGQEELAPTGRTDRADADPVDRVEVYASSHWCESTLPHARRTPGGAAAPMVSGRMPGGKLTPVPQVLN